MKIYTKGGDRGKTSLFGGLRVLKNHLRVQAYGDVDELAAHLGVLRQKMIHLGEKFFDVEKALLAIQQELFVLGSELATETQENIVYSIQSSAIKRLEQEIDVYTEELPPLTHFVIPSGCEEACYGHVTRTICRRAERSIVTLTQNVPIRDEILIYLNRLSDWFFVISRILVHRLGKTEEIWKGLP